jgi:hypothetical protein
MVRSFAVMYAGLVSLRADEPMRRIWVRFGCAGPMDIAD